MCGHHLGLWQPAIRPARQHIRRNDDDNVDDDDIEAMTTMVVLAVIVVSSEQFVDVCVCVCLFEFSSTYAHTLIRHILLHTENLIGSGSLRTAG